MCPKVHQSWKHSRLWGVNSCQDTEENAKGQRIHLKAAPETLKQPPFVHEGEKAVVISTFLYKADNCSVYRCQVSELHAIMMRHLRSSIIITLKHKVTNKELLDRTGLSTIEERTPYKNATRCVKNASFSHSSLLVKGREVDLDCGISIPSRETWSIET